MSQAPSGGGKIGKRHLVVFALDGQSYALGLTSVMRIAQIVETTSVPKAPEIVKGLINFEGRPIPVLDVRKRFGLRERESDSNDQLIIANTGRRVVCFPVDSVHGVIERPPEQIVAADCVVPGMQYVAGITALEDGIVFIHDLDRFLSVEEEVALDTAIPHAT